MKKTLLKSLALATVGVLCLAGGALAKPILTVTDGITTLSQEDANGDGTETITVLPGQNTLGTWSLSLTTGVTKPLIGSASMPQMDLNNVSVSGGTGTLTMTWVDDSFGPVLPTVVDFLADIGGTTTGSSVTVQYFYSLSSTTDVSLMTAFSPLPQSYTGFSFEGSEQYASPFSDQAPVSLAIVATVTHTNAAQISSFDSLLQVPEPGALLAFGTGMMGLVGIAAVRRRKDQE